ncbi:hypothetical protein VZ95_20555 [Elstera litoralis]|uniref:O-GlcNAc transferase C-terminal domain-containing protein n=1 Tax=Elstera litoralis TaxID=552518 RepID=A0A0F3IJB3_9PROT|nr:hypothetical protein [Elstera litoralis]KJV06762.1 hypothetical protein VZ95_20555 [Elstera litoralis]
MTSIDAPLVSTNADVQAHLRAAMAALRIGDIETAAREADAARAVNQSPHVLIVFAAIAHSMGRHVDALGMLEHASQLEPSIGNYPDAAAAILLKLGRKTDGMFNLKLGTHLPSDPFIAEIIGDYFGDVKEIFDSFIVDRPLRTAELMMSQNMYAAALHQLEVYIGVSGGDSLSFAMIAECALQLGKAVHAQVALDALRTLDAGNKALPSLELRLAVLKGDPALIEAQFAALRPPEDMVEATTRMQTMVASPYFDSAAISLAYKAIAAFVRPIADLDPPNFKTSDAAPTLGFLCEVVDPALENLILALKEHANIKVYALSSTEPSSQKRLKSSIEDLRQAFSIDDATLAEMIRMDEVSILFDCHPIGNFSRPAVLRSRVAPIQILWLREDGYDDPESYDYYLADSLCEDKDGRVLKLQNFLSYPIPALEVMGRIVDLRGKRESSKREASDQVRLLAPHIASMVSDALLRCWMDILAEVPAATLALIGPSDINDPYVQRILIAADKRSLTSRIDLIDPEDFKETLYDILLDTDLILDSFPRGNRDAMREALLIGCPIVTLAGKEPYNSVSSTLARSGAQLSAIAEDVADYTAKAVALASNEGAREQFNASLRKMHKDLTLAVYETPAAELFEKSDALWRNWCKVNA